ncbi:MAG TPA: hypothetical protein VNX70_19440 [Bryobacteraceae bacterium]|nr:hypothetical protein [Bryobacteraceae bacterium]
MFSQNIRPVLVFATCLGLSATAVFADTIAQCTPSFSDCAIPENVPLQFPFLAISGDVILVPSLEANLAAVSDVFRIANNFIDTGLGTGLGFSAFLFSHEENTLPDSSTYSANVVKIREQPVGPTQYLGNGTDYHLLTAVTPDLGGGKSSAPSKGSVLDLQDGPAAVATTFQTAIGQGPSQDPGQADGLAFYTANYTSLGGKQLPFNIVGTNPANGAASTTIPTVIVPIKVIYKLAGGRFLDGTNVEAAVGNSPIFLSSDYTVGGTDLGVTQYGDALQRGEFQRIPGFSPNYHVLLGTPTIAPTVTITVTSAAQGNLYRLRSGGLVGVVASGFFDAQLNALVHGYAANTLPIFLTDNVFEGFDGTINTCCVLGYHNSQGPPASTAKTWIFAAYTEPGTFRNDVILDVQPLSHEVAEWLNDPFVGGFALGFLNFIPPAVLPGQGGACIVNFETGDPLEAPPVAFSQITNGTTYHLQDEVFLPWYLHTTPSFSVNGWYTFRNTFTSFSSLCGPG